VKETEGPGNLFATLLPQAGASLLAIFLALTVGGVLIAIAGVNPYEAYSAMLQGAFGSQFAIANFLTRTTPLIFTGLAVAFAFRCNLLNIGAEGQLYMGGLAAVLVGVYVTGLSALFHIALAIAAASLAGAAWGGLAGLLKTTRGINEIISTIMLNFIAIFFVSFLIQGPIAEPPGFFHQTALIEETARLPKLMPRSDLSVAIFLAVFLAVALSFVLWRTPFGMKMRSVGLAPETARFSGISTNKYLFGAMAISGGAAGLAGGSEILGHQYRMLDFFSPGYGFDGIAVAFLGRSDPIGVVFAAMLFAALRVGANQMQRETGLPSSLVLVIQGLVVLFILAAELRRWLRERAVSKGKEA